MGGEHAILQARQRSYAYKLFVQHEIVKWSRVILLMVILMLVKLYEDVWNVFRECRKLFMVDSATK